MNAPDLTLRQIMDIFGLLILTYPRYVDAQSREAVENVGMELVRRDEEGEGVKVGVTGQILGWLSVEVGRLAKRGSPKYVNQIFFYQTRICELSWIFTRFIIVPSLHRIFSFS